MPIVSQIRNLFSKSDLYDNLGHRFRRVKTDSNCFEEIYDGSQIFSIMCCFCGIQMESKFSIWPLYFIINELPFSESTKRENMLFAGL